MALWHEDGPRPCHNGSAASWVVDGVRVVQGRQARQASCTAWMATAAAVREAPTAGVVVPTSATALTRSAAAVAFAEPAPPAGFVWGAIY